MRLKILIAAAAVLMLGGCSARECNGKVCAPVGADLEKTQVAVKSPEIRISPIIGTRSEESRIVRDFGVIQKAWVAPYIDQDGNLVAAHDIYVVIREPRWIPGEDLPKQTSGIRPPAGGLPFNFKTDSLDSSVDLKNDLTIREYLNEVYAKDANSSLTPGQIEQLQKYDQAIREFIKDKEQ